MPTEYTIYQLARKTGVDRETIQRWFDKHEIKPIRVQDYGKRPAQKIYGKEAFDFVMSNKRDKAPTESNIDPESGLTWAQAKLKEEALEKRRENEIADKLKANDWVSSETHLKILSTFTGRLEQIPGKAKSELGLSDAQAIGIRRMLDEARESTAKAVENGDE